MLVTLIVGLVGLAGLIVTERRLGDNAMLPPFLLASRSAVGANLFTALLYGPFTVMLTLIPFVMIRGAHLPTLVAGLAFIAVCPTLSLANFAVDLILPTTASSSGTS